MNATYKKEQGIEIDEPEVSEDDQPEVTDQHQDQVVLEILDVCKSTTELVLQKSANLKPDIHLVPFGMGGPVHPFFFDMAGGGNGKDRLGHSGTH